MAICATTVVANVPTTAVASHDAARAIREGLSVRKARPSMSGAQAISPATAPNDIWKLGPSSASDSRASARIAASARLRMLSAGRSTRIAPSITSVMISARSAATSQPEKPQ